MIARSTPAAQLSDAVQGNVVSQLADWQREMSQALTNVDDLLEQLQLNHQAVSLPVTPRKPFGLLVTQSYVRRMQVGDPNDPLLLQVLPSAVEQERAPGFIQDPVGDGQVHAGHGVLRKYQGRALLITTAACGIHCRYCFRQHFDYRESRASQNHWQQALAEISADASIREVLLSGGDPLMLTNRHLAELFDGLSQIPHVRSVRIHSRQPVVLPSRVDAGLMRLLHDAPWPVVLVIHANHAQELDEEVATAMADLAAAGARLYNQAVLLRAVNDSVSVLAQLSERLFELGVQPYYLHQLDRVAGGAHFEVPEPEAQQLMRALAAKLPGYLLPKWVREIEGMPYKQPLSY